MEHPVVASPAPSTTAATSTPEGADAAVDMCSETSQPWGSSEAGTPCPEFKDEVEFKDDQGGVRGNLIHSK